MHSDLFKGSISSYSSLNKKVKECFAIANIYGIDKKEDNGSFSKKTKDEKIESRER